MLGKDDFSPLAHSLKSREIKHLEEPVADVINWSGQFITKSEPTVVNLRLRRILPRFEPMSATYKFPNALPFIKLPYLIK